MRGYVWMLVAMIHNLWLIIWWQEMIILDTEADEYKRMIAMVKNLTDQRFIYINVEMQLPGDP